MLDPVLRASVPDLVFGELSRAILSGRYASGDRLPSQRALAAELGVNIASVREALGRLEQLRLVEVRHGEPMRVLDWRQCGLDALVLLGSVDGMIPALFEARRLLLVEAAGLAAQRRADDQAQTLTDLARAVAAAPDDATALRTDWEFMATIVEAAGNLVLELIMNSVRELYVPNAGAFVAVVADRAELAGLYAAAADAIASGEIDGARDAIDTLARAQEANMVAVR